MTPEELDLVATRLANSWYVGNTERFARALLAERTRTETLRAAVDALVRNTEQIYGDMPGRAKLSWVNARIVLDAAASVEETP